MAEKRGGYGFARRWLKELGYSPDERMADTINRYWGWYTADNDWYHYREQRGESFYRVDRQTLHPAALVAEAWSDLLMNEKLAITSDNGAMQEALDAHMAGFGVAQADFVTRAFAMGTGAWALSVSNASDDPMIHPDAVVAIECYDAHQVLPLTWSADSCTQCAFVTRVEVGGKDYDQVQAHVIIDGTYHILTQLFDTKSHRKVEDEAIMADLDTRSAHPTFAMVKPAVPNTHYSYCAMGASVFEKGISAIRAVDEAVTSMVIHERVARPKIFVDEGLIKKTTSKDDEGNKTTTFTAFGEADDIVYRTAPGPEDADPMRVVQPDMRADEHERAINTGLKMLSITCGLGDQYWSWDKAGGLKTATEVVSDSSMLARTLRKHQNALQKSIRALAAGIAGICNGLCGKPVDPDAPVSVSFDDSIITDTQTDKNMALTEISVLGIPELKRKYLVNWCGFTPEEAAAAVPDAVTLADEGF